MREMLQYDFNHHSLYEDLIHSGKSFFSKETFGEENLLDMLPTKLSLLKE